MKLNITITFILVTFLSMAQLIRRDAVVYSKANGDSLFELIDSTDIHIEGIIDGWYPSSKVALIRVENWSQGDSTVTAQAEIYNSEKKVIGKTISSFKAAQSKIGEGRNYKKFVWVRLDGYIHNNHIHYSSIPEKAIEKLVNAKSAGGLFDKLKEEVFDEFGFILHETEEYNGYVYLDYNITVEEEKPFRTIAVFRGETSLFCIITNGQPFELVKQKEFREEPSGNYYYLIKPSSRMLDAIEDIAYSFLPL